MGELEDERLRRVLDGIDDIDMEPAPLAREAQAQA
jgi:hypothetical protein